MCLTGGSMANSMSFSTTKNRSKFNADHPFIFAILPRYGCFNIIFFGRVVGL